MLGSCFSSYYLTVHDFDRFFNELKLVINLDFIQQVKSTGIVSNLGQVSLKGPILSRVKLSPFSKTYHPFSWGHFQHDLIFNLKLKGLSSYVSVALLTLTCSLNTDLDLNDLLICLVVHLWASELTISNFSLADRRDLQKCEANLLSRSEMNGGLTLHVLKPLLSDTILPTFPMSRPLLWVGNEQTSAFELSEFALSGLILLVITKVERVNMLQTLVISEHNILRAMQIVPSHIQGKHYRSKL
ncbi:hypothetical protein Tco_0926148 [Tanacetum coccineum]|uniref:Maturase n=1 Tax=Tanacetum coccineum TaxID=301880 RepID=A0ABQ5DF74_9ASTR